jgi:hypothetical protein
VNLRPSLIGFNNIIFNINVTEYDLVYFVPVYPAEKGGKKEWENDAPVSHNGSYIVDRVTDGHQYRKRKKKTEIDKGRRMIVIVSFVRKKEKDQEQ